jgi:hypothetical protein
MRQHLMVGTPNRANPFTSWLRSKRQKEEGTRVLLSLIPFEDKLLYDLRVPYLWIIPPRLGGGL